MRVAIDATPLTELSGGIGRYTSELAAALAAQFQQDDYWLVSDQIWKRGPLAANLHAGDPPRGWVGRRWWLAGLPLQLRRLEVDVFHGTDFAVPYLGSCPSVLTFHDASPWLSGDRRQAAERIRRRTPFLLRLATMIVTPTESIRRQVVERFGVPRSRTVAVPLAAGGVFRPRPEAETAAVLARLNASAPYLLFVGTRERRKNVARLAEAWREARKQRRELSLILAGRDAGDSQALNFAEEPGLTMAGRLPDEDIAALMAGAAAFVYPSLYEGFGLPVLEAMQAGTPVVISRDPALEEVAGGAAVSVDADSTTALARAIVELTGDPKWRLELRERGLRRAAQFSWRQTAIRTREVYVEALRRF